MGCCNSVPADRESETTHLISPTKKEPSMNVIPKAKHTNFENIAPSLPKKNQISESYQKNMKESEILQGIIEQTQQNFINISQSPGGMQLGMNTKQKVNQVLLSKEMNNDEIFGMPAFKSNDNIKSIATDGGVSEKNLKLMKTLCETLSKTMTQSFQINDEETGPLVMKLPEV